MLILSWRHHGPPTRHVDGLLMPQEGWAPMNLLHHSLPSTCLSIRTPGALEKKSLSRVQLTDFLRTFVSLRRQPFQKLPFIKLIGIKTSVFEVFLPSLSGPSECFSLICGPSVVWRYIHTYIYIYIYFFLISLYVFLNIWLHQVLAVACRFSSFVACVTLVPRPGSNPCPLYWPADLWSADLSHFPLQRCCVPSACWLC